MAYEFNYRDYEWKIKNYYDVEQLRKKIKYHTQNLARRKYLEQEILTLERKYNTLSKIISQKYEYSFDSLDQSGIKLLFQKQKQCLNNIDRCISEIARINLEICTYSDEEYKMDLEFINYVDQYEANMEKVDDIELVSYKALTNGDVKISQGRKLYNEYDKEYFILNDYVDTYSQLTFDQKKLASILKNKYGIRFKQPTNIQETPASTFEQPIQQVPTQEPETEKKDDSTVINNEDELSTQYLQLKEILDKCILPLDEEISLIEQFQNNILTKKNTGRKIVECINGKRIVIPKKFSGYYHNANAWLKQRLDTQRASIFENEPEQQTQIPSQNRQERSENNSNQPECIDINQFAQPITQIRKPKNKKSLKGKIKKIAAIVGAVAIFGSTCLVSTLSCVQPANDAHKNIKIENHLEKETIATQSVNEVNKNIINKTKQHHKKSKIKKLIKLGNIVKTIRGSQIYQTASDSVNYINGQKPYFSHNTSNKITGITLKLKNKIATFVEIPGNAETYEAIIAGKKTYLSKKEVESSIKKLKNKGFKEQGVAVSNIYSDGGITGYYNISDIKVKTK